MLGIDTEYDYCSPFLATTTDEELVSRVYRLKVLSQKRELKQICERRDIRKVFHHATGDVFQLRNIGITVASPIECTLIASNLVDENYKPRNLKKLVQIHLNIETKEANRLKSTIKKYKVMAEREGRQFKWSDIPESVMIPYAKRDPEYTIKLWFYWTIPLQESWKLYEFEKSLMPTIVDMQLKGLRIDRYRCRRISYEYGKKLEVLYDDMSKYLVDNKIVLGKDFNPRSVPQIQDIILQLGMGDVGEDVVDLKTRVPKTDKKALVKLSLDSKFFGMLQKSRFFSKHKGTYYDPLYEYYTSEEDDTAHFLIYQTGAKTGRFSVELAQTFPKPEENKLAGELHEVRKCIIPRRRKGFLCKDYEQQEARLFVHYSNCQRMIDVINKHPNMGRGLDIYVETAEMMFGKMYDNLKYRKPLRFVTKTDFLGGIYGEGVAKLVSSTVSMLYERFERGIVEEMGVNEQWAYDTLQKFYKLYPVREFMNEKISELYRNGFIELSFNSRLMNFTRRYNIPKAFAYKAGNAVIQGCLYGGSRVYTQEHGYITLKEIVDQIVTIWDGDRFVKAQCLYSGKKQKVIVQFNNGQQLMCSPEHKFLRLATNVEWCQAKDLKKSYRIVVSNAVVENRYNIRGGLQHDFDKYDKEQYQVRNSNKIDFTKIEDFDFGVLLGRLVSDGSITRDCDWLVAEHEFEIYKYLKSNLELMGKVWETNKGVREGRKEIVYHVTLGSVRLGRLFKSLKTEMPGWMFKNTEILRGYLRGMFDGDGSVNKEGVVMLVQGGEISWVFMRRIQEALLMFGVRSRLHFYDYGYRCFHLQISSKDNNVFAEKIGFINQQKQQKIIFSKVDYGEALYRTEQIDFVNIYDEEIDMYDIVNSESGKYAANGVITHNTAAYIIKHAMLRCNERIKKERWENRVSMLLQVHDELIFEVDDEMSFVREVDVAMGEEMDDLETFSVPITTSGKWSAISLGDVVKL